MPTYKIIVEKRIDEPGYRWRMGSETGILSDDNSRFLFKLVRAIIQGFESGPDAADNPDSVKWRELPMPITVRDLREHLRTQHDTVLYVSNQDELWTHHSECHRNAETNGWDHANAHTHPNGTPEPDPVFDSPLTAEGRAANARLEAFIAREDDERTMYGIRIAGRYIETVARPELIEALIRLDCASPAARDMDIDDVVDQITATAEPAVSIDPVVTATCLHCGRWITRENGTWVDLNAAGDDAVWRETCDSHDTFTAEHEPAPVLSYPESNVYTGGRSSDEYTMSVLAMARDDEGMPNLYDADTSERIGYATPEQVAASAAAANKDGGSGIIRIDRRSGAITEDGRRVYTDGWELPRGDHSA